MKKVKLFEQYLTEGKDVFPNEIVGNDQILFKKEWEKMNGGKLAAKYNQYYRGYDIDFGGHIFNSVDQLEKFVKSYILSNNLYNKYKYMPEKPIGESLKEGTYNNDKEIAIYDGEDGLTYIEKRGKGYYGHNNEFDFEADNKAELEKKLKSWKYKLISGSIDESTVNESTNIKDFFKDPMNLADAKGWVRNLKLSDDEIKTKIKAVMKDPSKFNDLMDAMTDELNLKWK